MPSSIKPENKILDTIKCKNYTPEVIKEEESQSAATLTPSRMESGISNFSAFANLREQNF